MELEQETMDAIKRAAQSMKQILDPGPLPHMGDFFAAFAKAQANYPALETNKVGKVKSDKGNYQFHYASLGQILTNCLKHLNQQGFAYTQPIVESENGTQLISILGHSSGASMTARLFVRRDQFSNLQQFGAAVTYLRRYEAQSQLGVSADEEVDEDDEMTGGAGQVGAIERTTGAHKRLPNLDKAMSIAEVNKAWLAVNPENRKAFQAHYDERMDALSKKVNPSAAAAPVDAGGF